MSLVIPAMPKKTVKNYMPSVSGDASSTAAKMPELGNPDPSLAARFGYSEGAARPDTNDDAARSGVLSRGSVIGSMLDDPGADRRARTPWQDPDDPSVVNIGTTPTRSQSAQEADYLQAQVEPAQLAEQRRQQAIELEARQIEAQQKLAAGEAARRFEEKYGVPYDKDAAKFIMESERAQQIEDDYGQKVAVRQSYLGVGRDSTGKPYDSKRYAEDLKKLAISRGLALRAPEGYFKAVAPPDPYGLGNQDSTVNQSLPPAIPPTS